MSNQRLHLSDPKAAPRPHGPRPLGRILIDAEVIGAPDLLYALNMQRYIDAPLGEILIAEGFAHRDDVLRGLAQQYQAQIADLRETPAKAALAAMVPAELCLKYNAVPWINSGGTLWIATGRPHLFEDLRRSLKSRFNAVLLVVADEQDVRDQITRLYGFGLAQRAATRVPAHESCRTWNIARKSRQIKGLVICALLTTALLMFPLSTLTALVALAFVTLFMTTSLKAAAFWTQVIHEAPDRPSSDTMVLPYKLPRVSVMVPLLREERIADRLIARLSRLSYPKSLLDVVLVLEAGDHVTRQTLSRTVLPPWVSVVQVPEANRLTTKPRALNYGLDFCKGSIIGVWDAEDAPEPDQIEKVVARFRTAPDRIACLQGILDYYNPKANWLARCFTIEYATWWRMLLPGVSRMGLVIPLGGTTLFFRRSALESLCGWDAHNVTEDADLGVRLARAGYDTELIPTITYEEANNRLWPWIRQRSRWLKGFLITWCVHMRSPRQLLADLGWYRFLGIQTLLLATVCQFILAPLLWSFWLILAGFSHPVAETLGPDLLWGMVLFFIMSETLNLALSMVAVSGEEHRHLMWWVFTLPLYFAFGALAAAKGLYEFVVSPFFWDKTDHGIARAKVKSSLLSPVVRLPASGE